MAAAAFVMAVALQGGAPQAAADASHAASIVPVVKSVPSLTKPCGTPSAWVGAGSDGIACADASGWRLITSTSPTSTGLGFVNDIAVSRGGVVWIVTSSSLFSTNGRTWTEYRFATHPTYEAVAVDAKGRVWLAGYRFVGSFDGNRLTTYPVSNLGKGEFVGLLKDVAVAPNATVWFATANSVASFNGTRWTYFEKGHGLDKQYFFNKLTVNRSGHVWAATTSDTLSYNGQSWTSANSETWQGQDIAVDARNHVWVATYSKGLAMFDGRSWTMNDRGASGIPSNKTKSVFVDGRGRVWVGTEWGLTVLSGKTWTTYHVSDANLPANQIRSLVVTGAGPKLPGKIAKKPGGLKGRLVKAGTVQNGLRVEICVEYVGTLLTSRTTPCTDQPFHRATATRFGGIFSFASLPAGDYVVTFRDAAGKWLVLSSQYGLGSSSQPVDPGKTTDLGTIDLAKAK